MKRFNLYMCKKTKNIFSFSLTKPIVDITKNKKISAYLECDAFSSNHRECRIAAK